MCFSFIDVATNLNVEKSMEDLCKFTWCLALAYDERLVEDTWSKLVPHKMSVEKDDGYLWFNKSCLSDRMATAIKSSDKRNLVYMYLGGGFVDKHQASMMHGIVVMCKSWRWAQLTYCAARIVGIRCSNQLGDLNSKFFSVHDSATENGTMSSDLICASFEAGASETWQKCCQCVSPELYKMDDNAEFNKRKQRVHVVQQIVSDFAAKLSSNPRVDLSSRRG